MTKIKMLAAAVAVASVSTLASANPPAAPTVYNTGPLSPLANVTNLSAEERAAYALLEGLMQAAEAKIHAHGCAAVSLPLSIYADSLATQKAATLGSAPNSMKLVVTPGGVTFRGQAFTVNQPAPGYLNGTPVTGYAGTMIYNSANNMMVGNMSVSVMSINWVPNTFTGYVIKDFYKGTTVALDGNGYAIPGQNDTHIIYDWGLQSLSKDGYPVEKYWQRSKVRRSDGGEAKTAFVKDRLVGVTPCRIAISLSGLNQVGIFQQSGTLAIQNLTPIAPVPEITSIQNI
jgi:hypothetical protein